MRLAVEERSRRFVEHGLGKGGITRGALLYRKRYWGQRFWQRGYFSTASGNITDDVIQNYLNQHTAKDGFSPST